MLLKAWSLAIWIFTAIPEAAGVAAPKPLQHGSARQTRPVALTEIAEQVERRQHGSEPPPQVADIVFALDEVAKTLKGHQSKMEAQANARKRECAEELSEHGGLQSSIRKGTEIARQENTSLQVINVDIQAHKNKVAQVNEDIVSALNTIKTLTEQLKTLRSNHSKTNTQAKMSLQELNKIINRVTWQEEQQQKGSSTEPAKLKHDVVNLKMLGSQLATTEDSDMPALLQVGMASSDSGSDEVVESNTNRRGTAGASGVLQVDRRELLRARRAEVRGFEEEEKKLLGLIDAQHKRLEGLQDQLTKEQLVLTDKLRQAASIRRTVVQANRGVERDSAVLESAKKLCDVQSYMLNTIVPLRRDVINLVTTSTPLLRSMDTAMFLAKDLKEFKSSPPSFVQLDARSSGSQGALGEAAQDASEAGQASVDEPVMLQQDVDAGSSSGAGTAEGTAGPFDNVISMIKTLMENIRGQANQDTNLNQWCLESAAEAQGSHNKIKQEQNEVSTQIVWAEAQIKQLSEEIEYLNTESARLETFKGKLAADQGEHIVLLDGQMKESQAAVKVLGDSVSALTSICKLNVAFISKPKAGGLLLSQGQNHVNAVSKKTQCQDAAELLSQAQNKLSALDTAMKEYKDAYNKVTGGEITKAEDDAKEQSRTLSASQVAKARSVQELATAEGDKKQKEQDLLLVEQSMRQTEQKCSVKETHAERMARRRSEIDALKSALKVLNGEEIPV